MKIAGIDVSRGKITVCIISEMPTDLKRFQSKYKTIELKADRCGIETLKSLDFEVAILEPSGGHYSKLWANHITAMGRIVRWVDHQAIANYRKGWGQLNKTDKADAIALAMYGLERANFVEPGNRDLRELHQQLQHCQGTMTAAVNRLRQQLAWECPELAEKAGKRSWGTDAKGIWQAVAGKKTTPKWQTIIDQSIGLGIGQFSREQAAIVCQIQRQQQRIELEASNLMAQPQYQLYTAAMEELGMGPSTKLALLSAIYPIEQFLNEGKEILEHVETASGKRARRNRSLARFKLACGLGMISYQSGDTERWKAGGRSDVRIALWQWAKIAVVINPQEGKEKISKLRHYYEHGTTDVGGKHLDPGVRNQKVMRVARRGLEMLYKELISKQ